MKKLKVIISGGGTGGHIFPAISIANAVKEIEPQTEILFVGAEGRMEMERIPAAGYPIIGLPVRGFDRKNIFKNISVLFDLWKSMRKARKIIKDFNPDIAVGVGGYASGPTLKEASKAGIPILIQEQNSYAGVTNKLLARKAAAICVAYENMERFFPKEKIMLTGNPVRRDLQITPENRQKGYEYFHLDPDKKTVLVVGGSLGARTINQSMSAGIEKMKNSPIQFIWQTGKYYYENAKAEIDKHPGLPLHLTAFITRMDLAYSVADLIVSRAGAGSISEFCLLEKPVILVPSPNVAEDHQTQNALALVNKNAAILVKDHEAVNTLFDTILQSVQDQKLLQSLSKNITGLAQHHSAERIAEKIIEIAGNN
ncbi:MAG: undecaprenyldiphospho-muramoylpentapeptide beta-N-acetylglucosaminyltransferase [Candidatus Azobacteroides sp.]|nr:undecaprenyldiphospho-muramoylpentapeptide beta-N-acetylglucosaminyltransferase [Candidatus Azobacteroides sp.]